MKNKERPELLKAEKRGGSVVGPVVATLIVIIFLLVMAGVWFRSNYVAYEIVGSSMEQTLFGRKKGGTDEEEAGDWVYARQGAHAERGDIVIVDVTDRTEFRDDGAIIKRLIAVEGDTVFCRNGVVYLCIGGGEPIPLEEDYAYRETNDFGPITLQSGEIFVMGDNRPDSYDCRQVGPLRYDHIVAVVPEWSVAWKGAIGKWELFRMDVRNFLANLF